MATFMATKSIGQGDNNINYCGIDDFSVNNKESNKDMEYSMGVYKNPKLIVPKLVTQSFKTQPINHFEVTITEDDPIIALNVANKKIRFENVINDNN